MVRGFQLDYLDFIELLSSTPCTRATVQEYLRTGFHVKVPRTSYDLIWERLEEQLGEEEAADASRVSWTASELEISIKGGRFANVAQRDVGDLTHTSIKLTENR
jgi:hypothetical protein